MSQLTRKLSALIAIVVVFSGCSSGGGGGDNAADNGNAPSPAPVIPVVKDLAVTQIGIKTATAIPGQSLATNVTVQNTGNVDAPKTKLSLWLSQDNIVDSADVAIGVADIAALATGAKSDVTVAATLPNNTAAGNYFVLADIVWTDDSVAANNVKAQATKVIVVNSTAAGVGVIATSQATFALVPTATGLTSIPVESGTPSPATIRASTPVNLDSCAFDSIANKTVCIGFRQRYVYFFDFQTDPTTGAVDVTDKKFCVAEDFGRNTYGDAFSGGNCEQCGVAVDPGENRFVIARKDGYSVLDYTIKADGHCNLLAHHEIPISESFGLDTKHKWLIAPEYEAGTTFIRTDGSTIVTSRALRIVDLNTNDIYTWEKKIDCAQLADPGMNCKLTQIDSAAVDNATGIVALTDETAEMVVLVDMSQAVFDKPKMTFSAPYSIAELPLIAGPIAASAIEPGSHTLFMAAEHDVGFTAVRLPTTSGTAGAFPKPSEWHFNSAVMPKNDVCDATPGDGVAEYAWTNMDEPHGLSVFGSATDGSSYGMLISQQKDCAALINLSKLINAPKIPGKNVIPLTGYDLEQNGIVRFVKIGG